MSQENAFRGSVTRFLVVFGVALLSGVVASGQDLPGEVATYRTIKHDVSPPLRDMAARVTGTVGPARERFLGRVPISRPAPEKPDPVLQSSQLPYQNFSTAVGFDGLGAGFPNFTVQWAPPDTNGAVGATQFVQWVNTSFAIWDKTGHLLQGPTPGNALWQGFGGGCETNNDGDPIIQYDKAANRWIFTQFSVSTKPYLQCLAISKTSDATGEYFRYAYSFGNKDFPDYPKLGVWPDGYYMSFNIFRNGATFSGPRACSIDRSNALLGNLASLICVQLSSSFGSLLPSDLDGSNAPPTGSPNYFLSFGTNSLLLWKFHVDFGTPGNSALTGPASITGVAPFTPACGGGACIPQLGTSQTLDSLADRLMYRLAYRRFSDHEALVVNHSVKPSAGASATRWYELRITNQNQIPLLYQQGTFAPDSTSRWMGSIAMDKLGDIALGYSVSSSSINPGIRFTGRVPGDPSGAMETEVRLVDGTGSQTKRLNRWGDYSSMAIDPVDDCTFWYTTEYLKTDGTFNWSTHVSTIKFGSCH